VLTPNPANDNVEVRLPASLGEGMLLITDMWGKLLLQSKVPESEYASMLTIPTEGFANGIYLVSITSKTGQKLVKKLTVTH
jgi:hypothetical protein